MQSLVSVGRSLLSNASHPLRSKLRLKPRLTSRMCHDDGPLALTSLCGLPHDVLLLILGFLDARALLVCKGVSYLFRSLINTDMLLTYRIELAINGMIDGPSSSGLTIPERFDKLRQYSERFCTGRFTRDAEMKLGRLGLGDMNNLMNPQNFRTPQPDSFGGTVCFDLPAAGDERSLMLYAPPSFLEGTSARRWTIPLSPSDRRILAVDVTQDLVVALGPVPGNHRKAEISLFSLESHGSVLHPLAEQPAWEIWMESIISDGKVAIQIYGPYIACKVPYDGSESVFFEDHLEVRNWKTGCQVWDDYLQYVCSYTFIDTCHLAVVFNSYANRHPEPRPHDTIGIYRIQEERDLPAGCVATLQLPRGAQVSTILGPSVPSPPTPPPSAAFWPDPKQRVVVLRLKVDYSPLLNTLMRILRPSPIPPRDTPNWADPWYGALLVIPCTTFQDHIRRAGTATAPTPTAWEDWGLRGSVLIRDESPVNPYFPREHYQQPPQFVFPFGSRLTFFAQFSLSARDGGPHLVALDTNPLSKLHPPHPGCTRRDTLACVEKLDEPGQSSILKTTHPRSYYLGPTYSSDVQRVMAITQNASGYAVLTQWRHPESRQLLEGARVFTV